jgi:hypothetical protein
MPDRPPTPWLDDPIRQIPTIDRDTGRAWRVDLRVMFRRPDIDPLTAATVALWMIEAPWAHPFWHSYVLSLIHLAPLLGLDDPILTLDHATHEIMLYALDPTQPRESITTGAGVHCLSPANYVGQFIEIERGEAIQRARLAVAAVCAGLLSPDSDARASWHALFGGR